MDLQTLLTAILVVQIGLLEFFILRNVITLRTFVQGTVGSFSSSEGRQSLFKEIAHGVMRAASERAGAVKGAATREATAGIMENMDLGAAATMGLAEFLPKKYRAFAPLIAPYIQQFMSKNVQLPQANQGSQSQGLP